MNVRSIVTPTHGRYLTVAPKSLFPVGILAGFHGYAENAEEQMERLRAISGSTPWLLVSVQALHRFYDRKTDRVVASWMTRQDRESAIADNIAYISACIDAAALECPALPEVVFVGFSQGVAMAYRAAADSARRCGVIAVGGDVPPELTHDMLQRLSVLLVRGADDKLYSRGKFAEDERLLRSSAATVMTLEYGGGHEWTDEVNTAASRFVEGWRRRPAGPGIPDESAALK